MTENKLPGNARFDPGWSINTASAISFMTGFVAPPVPGAWVMTHRLIANTNLDSGSVFGRYVAGGLTPNQCYVASCWVCITAAFEGSLVGLGFHGYPSFQVINADFGLRNCWQRISVVTRLPTWASDAHPHLYILGKQGGVIYSSCWKLEEGDQPTDYELDPDDKQGLWVQI